MKSLFTEIDSSSHTAVFSAQVSNLFIYFYCHCKYIFFQIDPLEPSFIDSVFRFRFHHSGFGVLVLPYTLVYTLSLIKTNKFKC